MPQPSETSLMGMRPFEGVISIFSPEFNYSKHVIRNECLVTVTQTRTQLLGAPVGIASNKAVLRAAANVTNANILGIIVNVDNDNGISAIATNTDSTVFATVLSKGPATFADAMLKQIDAAGAALNMANVRDSLLTANIRAVARLATESIQTT